MKSNEAKDSVALEKEIYTAHSSMLSNLPFRLLYDMKQYNAELEHLLLSLTLEILVRILYIPAESSTFP